MSNAPDDREFRKRMARIETLLHDAERFPDPKARSATCEIVQALMDLHGAGLERMLEKIVATGEPGLAMIETLARDELVGSLLLLYGLHPLDLETRVRLALDKVRPFLRSHGGAVELLSIAEGVVRLRIQGSCDSCPSSTATLKVAIEDAICEQAPDVIAVEVEGQTNGQAPDEGRTRFALPVL